METLPPGQAKAPQFLTVKASGLVTGRAASCQALKLDNNSIWDYIRFNRKEKMKIKEALKITDSFTRTSKMPGLSYSLPAWECKTGWKLAQVPGTPCFSCYAKKGNYTRYPAIKAAQYRRLKAIEHPDWVQAMAAVIKRQKFFRWHDAGDVQSKEHMEKILEVCRLTPDTKHWLPTQERQFLPDPEQVPDNLVIRLSRSKIDGKASSAWAHESGVTEGTARTCPAPDQKGQCLDCRKCWDKDVQVVIYGKH